jgi:hypothetical protein
VSNQTARVQGVTFTVPGTWTRDDVAKHWNMHVSHTIIVCPVCHKVDIRLLSHFDNCSPAGEIQRKQNQEVYWR